MTYPRLLSKCFSLSININASGYFDTHVNHKRPKFTLSGTVLYAFAVKIHIYATYNKVEFKSEQLSALLAKSGDCE
jgi:hypothetical protein